MLASENDHKEVVTCLVEAKAKLNLQDKVPSFPRDDDYAAMMIVVMIPRMIGNYNDYEVNLMIIIIVM